MKESWNAVTNCDVTENRDHGGTRAELAENVRKSVANG